MPMLDLSALGGSAPFAGLLNFNDTDPLNSVPGYSMRAEPDPYKEADKKKAEEAAALAARSVFDAGSSAVPQAGISGQMAMQPGAYGSLAPMLPQSAPSPQVAAAPPPIAAPAPSIPLPQPRPDAAPQADEGDTATPANAAPTQGQRPSAQPDIPETSMLGRLGQKVSDNSNLLLGLASGFAGAGSLGTGMSRGFAGAAAGGQLDQKAQQLALTQGSARATYEALVSAGAPRQQALIAAYNPESSAAKALVQAYIADRGKKVQIIKDAMGNEHPYEVNQYPKDGEPVLKPIDIPGGTGANSPSTAEPNYDPETKRDEGFLKTLDPVTASAVKNIADGKMPGTGRNLQKLMPYVSRYENGFDNTTYQARQNLQKSYFGGGEGAKALRSANTTIDHGMQLKKAIDDLGNYSTLPGVLNPVTGKIAEQAGDKKYQDALARFDTNSELYAKELEVALTGKSTVSGTNHIREMFDRYGSPVKNQSSLQQTLEMLQQRVNEHENTYNTGMNQKGAAPFDMLTRRSDLEKMLGQDTGSGRKSPEAGPLKPGKYVWSPNGGLQPQ